MELRLANERDCERLFKWIQDPVVRDAGFSDEEIEWEEHRQWFQNRLADEKTVMYMAELEEIQKPIGHIRFEAGDAVAEISVVLSKSFRGRGLGNELIEEGTKQYLESNAHINYVKAYIKIDNTPSRRAFEGAGYVFCNTKNIKGQKAVVYKFYP